MTHTPLGDWVGFETACFLGFKQTTERLQSIQPTGAHRPFS